MSIKNIFPDFSVTNILLLSTNDKLQGPFNPLIISYNFGSFAIKSKDRKVKTIKDKIFFFI